MGLLPLSRQFYIIAKVYIVFSDKNKHYVSLYMASLEESPLCLSKLYHSTLAVKSVLCNGNTHRLQDLIKTKT